MNHSESIKELATALAKAQAEIKGAIKDSENPFYKSKYADLSAVWDACRGPLSANGLSVVQGGTVLDGNAYLETLLVHSSGEWLSAIQPMHPAKDDPQGWVACTTYMRRAGLAAIAGVSPEDDDGNEASGKPAVGTKAAAQYVAKEKISTMTASRPTFDEQHAALKTEMDAKKSVVPAAPLVKGEQVIRGILSHISKEMPAKNKEPFVGIEIGTYKMNIFDKKLFQPTGTAPLHKLLGQEVNAIVNYDGKYINLVAIERGDIQVSKQEPEDPFALEDTPTTEPIPF